MFSDRDVMSDPDPTGGDAAAQRRTALWSVLAAVVLVALKLGTGLATGSLALVSAGIESSGDVLAALLTLLAIRMAIRPADADHNYGHRRAENVAALGEAGIVFVGGLIISFAAVKLLLEGGHEVDTSWYVFVVVALAVAIDIARIVASLRAAKRYASAAFRSNAFNFAGDLAGSLAVLLGLGLVAFGFEQGDAIAALLVAAVIFAGVSRLAFENVRALMDFAPERHREEISRAIEALDPPVELRRLRLREVGGQVFADVTIGLPPAAVLSSSHDSSELVADAVRNAAPNADVVVHAEPRTQGAALRERVMAAALSDPSVHDAHDVKIYLHEDGHIVGLHLKFDQMSSMADAHSVADRVEVMIRELDPQINVVFTHLEPLEVPVTAVSPARGDTEQSAIRDSVERILGSAPLEFICRRTSEGPVVFVVIASNTDASLSKAHHRAGAVERELRLAHPGLADVIVHTEPDG